MGTTPSVLYVYASTLLALAAMTLRYRQYAAVLLRRAALVLTAAVVAGALLRCSHVVDRSFIYFPSREIEATPGDVGLEFEDVRFQASDGVALHGWFVAGGGDATLVWFHGNGGNIGHRVGNIRELVERLQISIFIFDYRGYGRSEGSTYEEGTYLDAESAITYVRSRGDVDPEKTIYFGRSLGCAVAAEMAIKYPPRALICESGFTSVRAMTKSVYPFLPGLQLLVTTKYDTLSKIAWVDVPVMVLHGDRDEIVPFSMSRELFDAAKGPKRFYTIEGAGHNDTYYVGGPDYFEALREFVDEVIGEQRE